MKIVILDGFTCNPGDLSWAPFEAIGTCTVRQRTSVAEIVAEAHDAEVVITNKTPLTRATIEALPQLRYIGMLATGHNVVDGGAARERGIPVCNVPEYGTETVAQAVFALLLELTNRVGHHARGVREGRWCMSPDFSYWDFPLIELRGRTLGIVGLGRIGSAVARIGSAFGMRVIATRRSTLPASEPGIGIVDLEVLFRESDIISLHCPLTPETQGLVNAARLARMKKSALLINTARGALIDEQDLAAALNGGFIAGAGLDVLSAEPPLPDNPLLQASNCIITPHQGWATREARARLISIAARNLGSWLAGEPRNVVNS